MVRAFRTLGVWLTEAAIAGAPMIPLFIFVTSFIEHEGDFTYVLPFVLFYAFNKAGEYTLGMFGTVRNPYRIAQVSALIVIMGSLTSLLGEISVIFYDIGATLIGFGTSIFGTMYRTVKGAAQKDGNFPYPHADLVGFALMVVFSSLILLTQGHLEEVIVGCYTVLSIVALMTLNGLVHDPTLKNEPLFDYGKHDLKKGIPALCLLAIAFFVRLFKQTANTADVIVLFLLATVVLVVITVRKSYASKQQFEWHSVFYGEFLIFMILYEVFFFIGQGDIVGVLIVNFMQFAGQFLAMVFGKAILGRFENYHESNVLICLTMATGVLFLIPQTVYLSILLIGFLTKLGFMRVSGLYHSSENDLSAAALNLESQKMVGVGIIAGQSILVIVLALASFVMLHDSSAAMASYALRIFNSDLIPVFQVTQWICTAIFWLQGLALLVYEKRKTGSVFRDPRRQS